MASFWMSVSHFFYCDCNVLCYVVSFIETITQCGNIFVESRPLWIIYDLFLDQGQNGNRKWILKCLEIMMYVMFHTF